MHSDGVIYIVFCNDWFGTTTSSLETSIPGCCDFLGAMSSPRIGTPFWSGRVLPLLKMLTASSETWRKFRWRIGQSRIVKLHGSFPANFPLIFTEEDYRTYPVQFAPFVHTVRQAMMETVFCLIGFSGNDPNFLKWSDWVRENLGDAAPKIYLAGWLNISPHTRRTLEDRNVVPIDLARHPKAGQWPEHLRHDYATEWILHTLERGCPYNVTYWPSQRSEQYSSIPECLLPVHELVSEAPKEESLGMAEIKSEDLPNHVRQTLDVWTHNRRIYPGWLVVPASAQPLLSYSTGKWEPRILRVLSNFAPVERLNALRELVWRREILLDPISSELESAAEKALKPIDFQSRTIDGVADPQIEWATVREAWQTSCSCTCDGGAISS